MPAIAILVGISDYKGLKPLPCCRTDVDAIGALLEATGRFDTIHRVLDADAAALKQQIRTILDPSSHIDELFFYFSGHGHSDNGDFYFCPSDFNQARPNETGLSNSSLTALFRDSSPDLVVKVIDACSSGTLLIKSDSDFLPHEKGSLKSLVQIASCLETQTSLTGDPLSEFTERFCRASFRQTQGPVYYTDVISILRDEYLQDSERSPHFVFQASARETLVDDAAKLAIFGDKFLANWTSKSALVLPVATIVASPQAGPPTLAELLSHAEENLAKPADIPTLVNALFDGIKGQLAEDSFQEIFDVKTLEHSDFNESTTRNFIITVLSKEKRQDEFVTASIKKERKRNAFAGLSASLALGLYGEDAYTEHWDLSLNMRMERAQIRITLEPKFSLLQRIVLVVTCAPSLEHCYVFEHATRHPRTDWDTFSTEGVEITRRWYKIQWREDINGVVSKISEKLRDAVEEYIAATRKRVSQGEA